MTDEERKQVREIKELLLVDGVFYERTDFEKDCHPITTVHWTCIHTMKCKWFDKCYKQLSLKSLAPTDEEIKAAFASKNFITNVCLSYRHDFALMDESQQSALAFECKEWMRAIVNNWPYREKLTGVLINSEEKQKGALFDEEKTMM